MRIQLATSADYPGLTADDRIAAAALASRGIRVEPVIWSDQDVRARLDSPDAVVIRSCWDYHTRTDEFMDWLAWLDQCRTPVVNPTALVRWNLHKSYITDLAADGVPVVPTKLITRSDRRTLPDIIADTGWEQLVLKPAVSLSAHETWRTDAHDADSHTERFERLRAQGDVLVQLYLPQVTADGEWSLIFFGTQYSHAVRKHPKAGDFRVQIEHGGAVTVEAAPPRLVDQAAHVLHHLPHEPVYCRVDGVIVDGVFTVMEVECIDPVLFFAEHPPAAATFVDELIRHLRAH